MKEIKPFLYGLLIFVVLYLFAAFTTWDINAKHWPAEGRGAIALVSVVLGGFIIAILIEDDYKKY